MASTELPNIELISIPFQNKLPMVFQALICIIYTFSTICINSYAFNPMVYRKALPLTIWTPTTWNTQLALQQLEGSQKIRPQQLAPQQIGTSQTCISTTCTSTT
ncbi:hypothetical protein TNIN_337731 [Trichonephila inaurata madagascariensis]|uniref:Uncharacterized protein n=1 Tax=Trichonephila inaurata madagascariensis TaxID=2747483 RepID=A0A8X6M8C9_9ARAC|nr:hypothetical protein TNIN_337731 [Trichonephila inaurata madagascariensis]